MSVNRGPEFGYDCRALDLICVPRCNKEADNDFVSGGLANNIV